MGAGGIVCFCLLLDFLSRTVKSLSLSEVDMILFQYLPSLSFLHYLFLLVSYWLPSLFLV